MPSEATLRIPQDLLDAGTGLESETQAASPCVPRALVDRPEEHSDETLLHSVARGSKDALTVLFRRHGRAVRHVAWRILRDESEAEDLRQEVFLYLFERAKLFDAQKSSASSWIIQIAYHRAIDRKRFLEHRQHYKTTELDEERVEGALAQPSTDQIDGKTVLDKMRGELTPEQLQTLELHFFEGYSFREIAERKGQTVGNVRHHYYRALDRLRSNLFSKKQG